VEGPVEAADVIIKPWHEDELVFIAAISHPLVSRNPPIRVSDLAAEIIVMRERGSGTRDVAWDALLSTGWSPQRILEVSSNEAITRVVAAGLGIGIVSAAVAADHLALGRLRILSIEGLAIRRPLTRLILPDRQPSPATAAFNSLLDKGFPST
ncbi:MAG TPA: LysR substrate-binding domain-containing protein, partial [Microvirga sp.]|nr:LysR substrate-binding domain-containing protein [Microvirga sp.]